MDGQGNTAPGAAASPVPETGHECWLRYERPSDAARLAPYRRLCAHVVLRGCSPVLLTARDELCRGMGAMLGVAPVPHNAPLARKSHLVIGTAEDPWLARSLADAGIAALPDDGFAILPPVPRRAGAAGDRNGTGAVDNGTTDGAGPGDHGAGTVERLTVVGGSDRGCLYGSFALLRLMGTGAPVPAAPVVEHPAAALRIMNHWDNMDGSVERGYAGKSMFFEHGEVTRDLGRIADYGRLLASVGVNIVSLNNVNVDRAAMELLTPRHLRRLAAIAGTLRPFGIRLLLSVNFASPAALGNTPSAGPGDPRACRWWSDTVAGVYSYIPDLWGFIVKAGSEGQPGPHDYGRTHADGANMLADALAPYGGSVIWRCFVYNCTQDWRDGSTDRAKAAFEEFAHLDGSFADNVLLQVKPGPMDFQVREPASPLFGAMPGTHKLLEVQLAQEYTGQQVDLCYLVPAWKNTLDFDTHALGEGSTVTELVLRGRDGDPARSGIAAVANVGDDPNLTGHLLAQANLYGFGRLAWCPELGAREIATEWSRLTFGADEQVTETVVGMLTASWETYESYTSPLGLGWMVTPDTHYGPSVDGYEYSRWGTYHHADASAVGVDRTRARGTGFTDQYHEPWRSMFEDPERCPEELLLFFHRLPYSHRLRSGKTLVQHIYDTHFDGVAAVESFLSSWRALRGRVDPVRFHAVERRLVLQLRNAEQWRDVVNAYFHRKSGVPDEKGRRVF
jgi:alpha-glucuronidase